MNPLNEKIFLASTFRSVAQENQKTSELIPGPPHFSFPSMLRGRSTSLESAKTPSLSSTNHTYRILSGIIQSLELSSSHLEQEGMKQHLIDLLSSISLNEIELNPEEKALISKIQENQGNVEENLIQELILKMNEHLENISRGTTPARPNTFSPWADPLEVEEKKNNPYILFEEDPFLAQDLIRLFKETTSS